MQNKILYCALMGLFLTACSGPSKKQLAQYKTASEYSSQVIVDFFIKEIWNKPLNQVMKENRNYYAKHKVVRKILPQPKHNGTVGKWGGKVDKCNPKANTPEFRFYFNHKKHRQNQQAYYGQLGFAPRDAICTPPIHYNKPPIVRPRYGTYTAYTTDAEDIIKRLIKAGVPLDLKNRCFKTYDPKDKDLSYYCSIDGIPYKPSGKYEVYLKPSIFIRTLGSYDVVGRKLYEFKITDLLIGDAEQKYSLAEIYKTRMNISEFRKQAEQRIAEIRDQLRRSNQSYRIEQYKRKAKLKAYRKGIEAKHGTGNTSNNNDMVQSIYKSASSPVAPSNNFAKNYYKSLERQRRTGQASQPVQRPSAPSGHSNAICPKGALQTEDLGNRNYRLCVRTPVGGNSQKSKCDYIMNWHKRSVTDLCLKAIQTRSSEERKSNRLFKVTNPKYSGPCECNDKVCQTYLSWSCTLKPKATSTKSTLQK